jgi:hypothetical protein
VVAVVVVVVVVVVVSVDMIFEVVVGLSSVEKFSFSLVVISAKVVDHNNRFIMHEIKFPFIFIKICYIS